MDLDNSRQQFISYLEGKGRSKSTIIAYSKDIEQLSNFLQNKKKNFAVSDITSENLQLFVDQLIASNKYTLKTVSRKINSLKTFCKYLMSENLIVKDHSQAISHPQYKPQLPRVLSALEYRALRDAARSNIRLYTMVELLLQTGMRIGELSRLKKKDVDLSAKQIFIEEFSSNPSRTIEINELLLESLKNFIEAEFKTNGANDAYLFKTKSGNPVLIRNIRTAINRAFKKAGITNATVNDIRNTFIVFQLENGIKLEKLAEIVGHQKPSTTEKYLELVGSRPKRTITRITAL